MDLARGIAAQHGSLIADRGTPMIEGVQGDAWERESAEEIAYVAVELGERVAA